MVRIKLRAWQWPVVILRWHGAVPIQHLEAPVMPPTPLDGGCACGALRYRLHREPMLVHCCHCTRCQRETGGPFVHHAMIESTQKSVRQDEHEFVWVPTDSGGEHWVALAGNKRTSKPRP